MCPSCGNESAKWMGFCPAQGCGSQSPLVETAVAPAAKGRPGWLAATAAEVVELSSISSSDQPRDPLPSAEMNRVLGGGVVPGSVVLLAGEPGVGKSTLLLQLAQYVAAKGQKVLYVSGEESPQQIKLRSDRLGFAGEGILILAETDLASVIEKLDSIRPGLAIVDSIQTLYSDDDTSSPGSVGQVREAGLRLLRWAKDSGTPVFVSGHMTKDGSLAGPRVLEHMVDVVLYLESQEDGGYRVLRAGKNRFGATTEVGVFEMTEQGLADVSDPSKALLSQRAGGSIGAALAPVVEGSRALLLEVQALTSPSQLPAPRRVANGVDYNRLLMLAAVASRRAGLELSGQDIIVNVAGGFKISEPAADLALVLAMASSLYNCPLDPGMFAFGEVGLSAEIRSVPQAQRRVAEAARLGLKKCILPESCLEGLTIPQGMKAIGVRTLRQAINAVLTKDRDKDRTEDLAWDPETALEPG
ncbi:MAG: DNA repair protein RadA [Chloroflexi bacterium]|nr:DNA repair protein RadA [Chloroflexota bacterium]MCI0809994.1 DNA repair protein RadA [Chloroflexota bacterium]MCI0847208.1 DNA repair protein RadA [Chloroflexota bacterium]MCI0896975.1 DNA repair protein RadA [Chloroflexota bacterium]MCI0901857.1 DNA repair protein RadA [Chloroflexota bacterium]